MGEIWAVVASQALATGGRLRPEPANGAFGATRKACSIDDLDLLLDACAEDVVYDDPDGGLT